MDSRKAQGATEYMIILAVVIIIALLAILVLKGVPSIGKSGAERSSAAFWSTADIGFMSYAVDSSGIVMNIRNNFKNTITITKIELSDESLTTSPSLPETLAAGEEKTFTSDDVTCTAGNRLSYDVEIEYTDEETSAEYTFTGTGNKLEGTCAS
ncbi:class III signal peptide-containing protein [Candidatus Woesearchaeota archaeon]|nr:class III signal peptide-containing protein [Candidatus Woesearchaeota archaeon]